MERRLDQIGMSRVLLTCVTSDYDQCDQYDQRYNHYKNLLDCSMKHLF